MTPTNSKIEAPCSNNADELESILLSAIMGLTENKQIDLWDDIVRLGIIKMGETERQKITIL